MDLLSIKPHVVTEGILGKKMLVYGKPGTWKTTFLSGLPKPLLLATEVGYTFIPGIKAVNIRSWYDFSAAIEQLKKPEVRAEFDTIGIDTLGLLSQMCVKYICSKNAVDTLSAVPWGAAWKQYKEALSSAFNTIAQLGYGIVFISHSKEANHEDTGELLTAGPVLDNQTLDVVNALVDFIFFLQKEQEENGQINVYAYSNTNGNILSKARAGLDPRIMFTPEAIDKAISKATIGRGLETSKEVIVEAETKLTLEDIVNSIRESGAKLMEIGLSEFVQSSLLPLGVSLNDVTQIHYETVQAIDFAFKEKLSHVG